VISQVLKFFLYILDKYRMEWKAEDISIRELMQMKQSYTSSPQCMVVNEKSMRKVGDSSG